MQFIFKKKIYLVLILAQFLEFRFDGPDLLR
jgi:hypothetical protein